MRITPMLFALALACGSEPSGDPPFMSTATDGSSSAGATDTGDHDVDHGTQEHDDGSSSAPPPSASSEDTAVDSDTSSGAPVDSTGATIDTWENWALPSFFDVYCNHCHPGDSPRDFTMYAVVVDNVEHIRCGVAPEAIEGCDPGHIEPGHLPIGPGPYPSDDERWRLVDWIDAGMPMDGA